ncbi:hypothetical protein HPB50_001643 [Hyalomma asiaticum]|uniref:Uncharacterized protein n=1 Tax=Hyalomma asiaticum TaxID=266040 RepID=A0ACB7S9U9_HYAAI|nr:hypothetical protein HPB50_001643 [Hyalomma asiaticum]
MVIPYIHGVTHKLQRIAGRSWMDVVFSAPEKLAKICRERGAGIKSLRGRLRRVARIERRQFPPTSWTCAGGTERPASHTRRCPANDGNPTLREGAPELGVVTSHAGSAADRVSPRGLSKGAEIDSRTRVSAEQRSKMRHPA